MSLKKNLDGVKQFGMILNSIDNLVPKTHIVRKYEIAIDWNFIYDLTKDLYSKKGAPAIDPVVLFKMVMLNYLEGRSTWLRRASSDGSSRASQP